MRQEDANRRQEEESRKQEAKEDEKKKKKKVECTLANCIACSLATYDEKTQAEDEKKQAEEGKKKKKKKKKAEEDEKKKAEFEQHTQQVMAVNKKWDLDKWVLELMYRISLQCFFYPPLNLINKKRCGI
jgi:colicin import membrane protein